MSAWRFNLALLVRRSLARHRLSTLVTACSLALASGLVMALFVLQRESRAAFTGRASTFDAVLGARGSQLQLVLNSVFHLETSTGNLPWSHYQKIAADPRVEAALPLAVGDHYRGWRVVGTNVELFDPARLGDRALAVRQGRAFAADLREAVVGSQVARAGGLRLGASFQPSHGLAGEHHHDEEYLVVGELAPTGTAADRVIWIPIEGVFRMGGHVLRGSGEDYHASHEQDIPDEHKEVSAVLLALKSLDGGVTLDREINRVGKEATLAFPIARSVAELFDKLGWMAKVLELAAYLALLVGAGGVLASLYNTLAARRGDFAILRALGARRRTLFAALVGESAAIALCGAVLGLLVYAAILLVAAAVLREKVGLVLPPPWQPQAVLLWAPLGTVALGALVGLVPAWSAYRTEVARNLP
jgi:putative ABC transport system permease protein